MFDALAPKSEKFSLQVNVEKTCNVVFKQKNKRLPTTMTLQGHPLKLVCECIYLVVVLMDKLACTSDVEWSKSTFSKYYSIYKRIIMLIQTSRYTFFERTLRHFLA